jgi:hypothetical protein
MRRNFSLFWLLQWLLLGAPCLLAGRSVADGSEPPLFQQEAVGPAPPSLVLDQARLFKEQEAAQISARLKAFAADHGVTIYVAAYSVLVGEAIDERVLRLKREWLAGTRGIIVAYQRGTDKISFAAEGDKTNFVGRSEMGPLFEGAYLRARSEDRGSRQVAAALDHLLEALPPMVDAQRVANEEVAVEWRQFVTWSLGGILLLAAGGMYLSHALRRTQIAEAQSFIFPTVQVPGRLGGSYSGGWQAEIEFTTSQ